jgi:hypothetical protein
VTATGEGGGAQRLDLRVKEPIKDSTHRVRLQSAIKPTTVVL